VQKSSMRQRTRPKKPGPDHTKFTQNRPITFTRNEAPEKDAQKIKNLPVPNTDYNKQAFTDEKAYPTKEAAPKFRQPARWECCWL
jgi:hypothetical protein